MKVKKTCWSSVDMWRTGPRWKGGQFRLQVLLKRKIYERFGLHFVAFY